ncbi:hypothetical protein M0802_005140 [Mischocyttarus mexicanus]|nr:hypothetical protein M0802_005140 [Mischocyttarus mexicanus]
MRSDRDAINNDALTDPMAGGRPHESHDLTFACLVAWLLACLLACLGCPRPIASREPIAMRFFHASQIRLRVRARGQFQV